MSPEVNRRFHAYLNQTGQMADKAEIVEVISNFRTSSSKDLTDAEVLKYIGGNQSKKEFTPKGGKGCDTKRKKIIAIFRGMGGTVEDAKKFAESMKGMNKKFNDFNSKELSVIIEAAEAKKNKVIQNFNQ